MTIAIPRGRPLDVVTTWVCPNCPVEFVTDRVLPNRFHNCPGLGGLTAPLVKDGTKCKVVAVLREDAIGTQRVRLDDRGRPIAGVHLVRDDGQDAIAFAPRVTTRARSEV